jgi:hypothetical protein
VPHPFALFLAEGWETANLKEPTQAVKDLAFESQRSNKRDHLFVGRHAAMFGVCKALVNCIQVLLFQRQKIVQGLCNQFLAPLAGLRRQSIESHDLSRFEVDL